VCLCVFVHWQLQSVRNDKSKLKQELEDADKKLSDKIAAEKKAREDVKRLTSEKVITTFALVFL